MRTPTWGRVEHFCKIDGWRGSQKVLADGTVLQTHRSLSKRKTMSPGRFKAILRYQLKIDEEDFWRTLDTGKPVR